jgi:hypothetical protein
MRFGSLGSPAISPTRPGALPSEGAGAARGSNDGWGLPPAKTKDRAPELPVGAARERPSQNRNGFENGARNVGNAYGGFPAPGNHPYMQPYMQQPMQQDFGVAENPYNQTAYGYQQQQPMENFAAYNQQYMNHQNGQFPNQWSEH